MVVLALLHLERHGDLGEEGLALAKVRLGVEAQRPGRRALDLAQHLLQRVDGHVARLVLAAVRQPRGDAAVVVGLRLEGLERVVAALQLHADALGGLAERRVEDVAGDGVFGCHCVGMVVAVGGLKLARWFSEKGWMGGRFGMEDTVVDEETSEPRRGNGSFLLWFRELFGQQLFRKRL